jgi:hypothetical protein
LSTLDALALEGRLVLARRDAERSAEAARRQRAAAAGGSDGGASRPWWRFWQQTSTDAQLNSSSSSSSSSSGGGGSVAQPAAEELQPQQWPKRLRSMPWGNALVLLDKYPGHAFLQPDAQQV